MGKVAPANESVLPMALALVAGFTVVAVGLDWLIKFVL